MVKCLHMRGEAVAASTEKSSKRLATSNPLLALPFLTHEFMDCTGLTWIPTFLGAFLSQKTG